MKRLKFTGAKKKLFEEVTKWTLESLIRLMVFLEIPNYIKISGKTDADEFEMKITRKKITHESHS